MVTIVMSRLLWGVWFPPAPFHSWLTPSVWTISSQTPGYRSRQGGWAPHHRRSGSPVRGLPHQQKREEGLSTPELQHLKSVRRFPVGREKGDHLGGGWSGISGCAEIVFFLNLDHGFIYRVSQNMYTQ